MRKIMNQPETMVMEMCNGIAMAHPELEYISKYKVIKKRAIDPQKVSLISGGGSGHEPAHAGFVGRGMLDAAVCGDIFASPSQVQVYQAIKETAGQKGTLLIIKNYSGDMMNFKNAAHLAAEDGIAVDYVKVDDDIAVQDSLYTVGRRGVAGTVFVHKIAGAAAQRGASLEEVKAAAQEAAENIRSIGFAFSSCTVPAKGSPTFEISEGEMEYGVGIHGEPGIKREPIISADELAERMVDSLLKELAIQQEEIAVLVNGFGGTPLSELYVFNNAVARVLHERNIKTYRIFVGNYMTSIDMLGASLSFMKLNPQLQGLLDEQSDTPAFKVSGPVESNIYSELQTEGEEGKEISAASTVPQSFAELKGDVLSLQNMVYMVDQMGKSIIKNEVFFCELDSHAGDGDFGMSVAKGFKQLKREWPDIMEYNTHDIGEFLEACSLVIMEYCGGASGPIWGSAFRMAGRAAGSREELSIQEFADILYAAVGGIQKTGERSFGRGAQIGDKTLIDALLPCAKAWAESAKKQIGVKKAFEKGAMAAEKGAKATENIVARMGRAGTVGDRSLGYPDAGAYALGVIFTDISNAMRNK